MLRRLWDRGNRWAPSARQLYDAAVQQARRPVFYTDLGVPDSLDGRFELIALHVYLVLRRLKDGQAEARGLAQALFDAMFADMDNSLREMGAGDVGVGPRVKRMAQGFYGRIAAYDAGLAGSDGELAQALRRNLYGTVAEPEAAAVTAMTAYVRRAAASLRGQSLSDLSRGRVTFAAVHDPAMQDT